MKRRLHVCLYLLFITITSTVFAQVAPTNSPYTGNGNYGVVSETLTDATPALLTFRPDSGTNFPILIFQPGANAAGADDIDVNTYDLYLEHLASYGYVVVVIDNMQGGPNGDLFNDVHDRVKNFVADAGHWMSSMVNLEMLLVGGHSNGGLNASELIVSRPNEVQGIVYMASYPNPGIFGFGGIDVSGYTGNVLLMVGDEDATSVPLTGTTNEVALEAYEDKFQSADCKTFIEFEGVGHGGFGDYTHDSHTVGTIGRADVTATIRHYLVSFMERTTKSSASADAQFMKEENRLNPVATFLTSCTEIGGGTAGLSAESEETMIVYPNPVSEVLYFNGISSEALTVVVYNAMGQIVVEQTVTNALSVSSLPKGTYTVVVNNTYSQIFIKE